MKRRVFIQFMQGRPMNTRGVLGLLWSLLVVVAGAMTVIVLLPVLGVILAIFLAVLLAVGLAVGLWALLYTRRMLKELRRLQEDLLQDDQPQRPAKYVASTLKQEDGPTPQDPR